MLHKLAFIGFGTVGQGLAEILQEKGDSLAARYGVEFRIVAVSDLLKGAVYRADGLDISQLLDVVQETGKLDGYPDGSGVVRGWDSLRTIRETNADTIVEVSWTDTKTGEPAISHCKAAFESGKNIVMTNKGPVALAYRELIELARTHGVQFRFEGTVMSGTPALRLALTSLAGCEISEIQGILNGTTNFILTQMEAGKSYAQALAEAQRLGYAEADPTADVEGHDAQAKVTILANVLMDAPLKPTDVACTGITSITPKDIATATAAGERWKLIGRVVRMADGSVVASVAPVRLPLTHPLASVGGATNAITFTTDLLGDVTLVGPGAGRKETGFALLSDLLEISRQRSAVSPDN